MQLFWWWEISQTAQVVTPSSRGWTISAGSQLSQLCLVSGTLPPFLSVSLNFFWSLPLFWNLSQSLVSVEGVLSFHPAPQLSLFCLCSLHWGWNGLWFVPHDLCCHGWRNFLSGQDPSDPLCPLPLLPFPFLACVSQGQPSVVPETAPPASP